MFLSLLNALNNLRETGANCGSVSMSKADALSWNETLASAALQHANDMNDNDTGKAWIFGDNIDTDQIIPSQYLMLPIKEASKHI